MVEHKTVIDGEGFIVERCVRVDNGLVNFFMKQDYKLVTLCKKQLVKGKFVNGEFIETATEEEKEIFYKNLEM